jgi:hypothetical protein
VERVANEWETVEEKATPPEPLGVALAVTVNPEDQPVVEKSVARAESANTSRAKKPIAKERFSKHTLSFGLTPLSSGR